MESSHQSTDSDGGIMSGIGQVFEIFCNADFYMKGKDYTLAESSYIQALRGIAEILQREFPQKDVRLEILQSGTVNDDIILNFLICISSQVDFLSEERNFVYLLIIMTTYARLGKIGYLVHDDLRGNRLHVKLLEFCTLLIQPSDTASFWSNMSAEIIDKLTLVIIGFCTFEAEKYRQRELITDHANLFLSYAAAIISKWKRINMIKDQSISDQCCKSSPSIIKSVQLAIAECLYVEAMVNFSLGQLHDCRNKLQDVLQIQELLVSSKYHRVIRTMQALGRTCFYISEYDEAILYFNRLHKYIEKNDADNWVALADCLRFRGSVFLSLGKFQEASKDYQNCVNFRRIALEDDSIEGVESIAWLAHSFTVQGFFEKAANIYREVLESPLFTASDEELLNPDNYNFFDDTRHDSSSVGEITESGSIYTAAQMAPRVHKRGRSHIARVTAEVHLLYGQFCIATSDYWLGLHHMNICLNLLETRQNGRVHTAISFTINSSSALLNVDFEDHLIACEAQLSLAQIYRTFGKIKEATLLLASVGELHSRATGEDCEEVAECMYELAELSKAKGNYNDAKILYSNCLAIRYRIFGKLHPKVASVIHGTAENLYYPGNLQASLELVAVAIEQRTVLLGEYHPDTIQSKLLRTRILLWQNKSNKAIDDLTDVWNHLHLNGLGSTLLAARCLHLLGGAERAYKRLHVAMEHLTKALDIYRSIYRMPRTEMFIEALKKMWKIAPISVSEILRHTDEAMCLQSIALVKSSMNLLQEAKDIINMEVDPLLTSLLGPKHPYTLLSRGLEALFTIKMSKDEAYIRSQRIYIYILLEQLHNAGESRGDYSIANHPMLNILELWKLPPPNESLQASTEIDQAVTTQGIKSREIESNIDIGDENLLLEPSSSLQLTSDLACDDILPVPDAEGENLDFFEIIPVSSSENDSAAFHQEAIDHVDYSCIPSDGPVGNYHASPIIIKPMRPHIVSNPTEDFETLDDLDDEAQQDLNISCGEMNTVKFVDDEILPVETLTCFVNHDGLDAMYFPKSDPNNTSLSDTDTSTLVSKSETIARPIERHLDEVTDSMNEISYSGVTSAINEIAVKEIEVLSSYQVIWQPLESDVMVGILGRGSNISIMSPTVDLSCIFDSFLPVTIDDLSPVLGCAIPLTMLEPTKSPAEYSPEKQVFDFTVCEGVDDVPIFNFLEDEEIFVAPLQDVIIPLISTNSIEVTQKLRSSSYLYRRAIELFNGGYYLKSLTFFEECITIRKFYVPKSIIVLETLIAASRAFRNYALYTDALIILSEATGICHEYFTVTKTSPFSIDHDANDHKLELYLVEIDLEIGDVYYEQLLYSCATTAYQTSLLLARKGFADSHILLGILQCKLGLANLYMGKILEALKLIEEGSEVVFDYSRLLQGNGQKNVVAGRYIDDWVSFAWCSKAALLQLQLRWNESSNCLNSAIACHENVHGSEEYHPSTAEIHLQFALFHYITGNLLFSRNYVWSGKKIFRMFFEENHPKIAQLELLEGDLWKSCSRFQKANKCYLKALDMRITRINSDNDNPGSGVSKSLLCCEPLVKSASIHVVHGHYDVARELLLEAIHISISALLSPEHFDSDCNSLPSHPTVADIFLGKAILELQIGEYKQCHISLTAASAMRSSLFGELGCHNHPMLCEVRKALGDWQKDTHRTFDALKTLGSLLHLSSDPNHEIHHDEGSLENFRGICFFIEIMKSYAEVLNRCRRYDEAAEQIDCAIQRSRDLLCSLNDEDIDSKHLLALECQKVKLWLRVEREFDCFQQKFKIKSPSIDYSGEETARQTLHTVKEDMENILLIEESSSNSQSLPPSLILLEGEIGVTMYVEDLLEMASGGRVNSMDSLHPSISLTSLQLSSQDKSVVPGQLKIQAAIAALLAFPLNPFHIYISKLRMYLQPFGADGLSCRGNNQLSEYEFSMLQMTLLHTQALLDAGHIFKANTIFEDSLVVLNNMYLSSTDIRLVTYHLLLAAFLRGKADCARNFGDFSLSKVLYDICMAIYQHTQSQVVVAIRIDSKLPASSFSLNNPTELAFTMFGVAELLRLQWASEESLRLHQKVYDLRIGQQLELRDFTASTRLLESLIAMIRCCLDLGAIEQAEAFTLEAFSVSDAAFGSSLKVVDDGNNLDIDIDVVIYTELLVVAGRVNLSLGKYFDSHTRFDEAQRRFTISENEKLAKLSAELLMARAELMFFLGQLPWAYQLGRTAIDLHIQFYSSPNIITTKIVGNSPWSKQLFIFLSKTFDLGSSIIDFNNMNTPPLSTNLMYNGRQLPHHPDITHSLCILAEIMLSLSVGTHPSSATPSNLLIYHDQVLDVTNLARQLAERIIIEANIDINIDIYDGNYIDMKVRQIPGLAALVAKILYVEGDICLQKMELTKSLQLFEQSNEYRRLVDGIRVQDFNMNNVIQIRNPLQAPALLGWAATMASQGAYDDAIERYALCGHILAQFFGKSHPRYGEYLLHKIKLLVTVYGRYQEAIRLCLIAMKTFKTINISYYPDYQNFHDFAGLGIKLEVKFGSDLDTFSGHPHYLVSSCALLYAEAATKLNDFYKASQMINEALLIRKRVFGVDHLNTIICQRHFADITRDKGKLAETQTALERVLCVQRAFLMSNHPEISVTLTKLAFHHLDDGQYKSARSLFSKAIESLTYHLKHAEHHAQLKSSTVTVQIIAAKIGLAVTMKHEGIYIEAARLLQDLLLANFLEKIPTWNAQFGATNTSAHFTIIYDHPHPLLGVIYELLSELSLLIGDVDASIREADIAIAIHRQVVSLYPAVGSNAPSSPMLHLNVASSLDALGNALLVKTKVIDAKNNFLRAQSIRNDLFMYLHQGSSNPSHQNGVCQEIPQAVYDVHPSIATSLLNLAAISRLEGKYIEAGDYLDESLRIAKISFGTHHPMVARILCATGEIATDLGYSDVAEKLILASYSIRRAFFGIYDANSKSHPAIDESLFALAELYRFKGMYQFFTDDYQSVGDLGMNDHLSVAGLRQQQLDLIDKIKFQHLSANSSNSSKNLLIAGNAPSSKWVEEYVEAKQYLGGQNGNPNLDILTQVEFKMSLPLHKRVHESRILLLGEEHMLVVRSLTAIGHCLLGSGKFIEAIEDYRKALYLARRVLGESHLLVAEVMLGLADVLTQLDSRRQSNLSINRHNIVFGNISRNDEIRCEDSVGATSFSSSWISSDLHDVPSRGKHLHHLGLSKGKGGMGFNRESVSKVLICRSGDRMLHQHHHGYMGYAFPDKKRLRVFTAGYSQGANNEFGRCSGYDKGTNNSSDQGYGSSFGSISSSVKSRSNLNGDFTSGLSATQQSIDFEDALWLVNAALLIIKHYFGNAGHPLRACALFIKGDISRSRGNIDESANQYKKALAIRKALFSNKNKVVVEHPLIAQSIHAIGISQLALGKFCDTPIITYFESALGSLNNAFQGAHPWAGLVEGDLARYYLDVGQYPEAEKKFDKSLQLLKIMLGENHLSTLRVQRDYGQLLRIQGKISEEEVLYRRVIEASKKIFGTDNDSMLGTRQNPFTLSCLSFLGLVLLKSYRESRIHEAGDLLRSVHAEQVKLLGTDHPDTLQSLSHVATVAMVQGSLKEARDICDRISVTRTRIFGREHPLVASSLSQLAGILFKLSQNEEASKAYRECLWIRERAFGMQHYSVAETLNNLGLSLSALGKHRDAIELLQRALSIKLLIAGDDASIHCASSMNNIGGVYHKMEELEEARHWYNKALAIRVKILGEEHHDSHATMQNLKTLDVDIAKMRNISGQ